MTDTDLLSSAEAALILRCSDRQVRQLAAEGVLPRIRLGSRWWFRRGSLLAWLAAQERPGSAAPTPVVTRWQAVERHERVALITPTAEDIHAELARMREEMRQRQARPRRAASGGANVVDLTVHQDGAASSASTQSNKEPRRS